VLAALIQEAVVKAPLTLPGLDNRGSPIQPGKTTTPFEAWAELRAENINDIQVWLPLLSPDRAVPLLLQILEESREVHIQYESAVAQYIVMLASDEEMREAGPDPVTVTGSVSDADTSDLTAEGTAQDATATPTNPQDCDKDD
jgi:hypothetical protein